MTSGYRDATVVLDADVAITLRNEGKLAKLTRIFGRVLVPRAVAKEVPLWAKRGGRRTRDVLSFESAAERCWWHSRIHLRNNVEILKKANPKKSHLGEAEGLAQCLHPKVQAHYFVTNDNDATISRHDAAYRCSRSSGSRD